MTDDFERLVERSLDRRAADLGTATGQVADVLQRVDQRRSRRRSVAIAGSLAVVGVGAFGLAALDREPAEQAAIQPAGHLDGDAAGVPDQQAAWRCTDQLAYFGDEGQNDVYFATCEQVAIDGGITILGLPATTMPDGTLAPVPTTAPPQEVWYTVEEDDTAESIADAFDVAVDELVARNDVNDDGSVRLVVGESILVTVRPAGDPSVPITAPPTTSDMATMMTTTTVWQSVGEQEYLIQVGDSLGAIADRYSITLDQLINYNQFADGVDHLILPGDIIKIPPDALRPPLPTTTP